MRKQELLDALDAQLDAYVYGILAPTFVPQAQWRKLAESPPESPEADLAAPLRTHAVRVAQRLSEARGRQRVTELHRDALNRALLFGSFDLVRAYAAGTGQVERVDVSPEAVALAALRGEADPELLAERGSAFLRYRNRRAAREVAGKPATLTPMEALSLYNDIVHLARDGLR